jgi:hypothetical protein
MRVVLDLVLTVHYAGTGKDLKDKIDNAKERLPSTISWAQFQRLRGLGNDAVHIRPKELQQIKDEEREIVKLLAILRTLIEQSPTSVSS